MFKVDCIPKELHPFHIHTTVLWKKSVPFYINHRGVLVHRIKAAASHLNENGSIHHCSIDYWCGNCTTSRHGEFTDLRSIDVSAIVVCESCERRATQNGFPTTDLLVGQHVHVGRAKAVRTCCKE